MAFALSAFCCVANAAVDKTAELEYLGNPADDRWSSVNRGFEHAALDLEVFHDRVFVGTGNWDSNFGPCYIPAFDTATGAYRNEYTAGTESIETIRTFDDDTLCVPATDHCEGGAYGYVNRDWFSRTADGAWSGGSASPNSGLGQILVHNWDMAKFGDWIFCGGYGVAGSKAGGIWSSVAEDPGNSLRVTSFIRCGDELFCRGASSSVYFSSGKPDDNKAGYQPKLWHWNKTSETFEQVTSYWANMMPGVRQADFALTYANPATYANHHAGTWHATPFKSRNLYIVGTVGYSVNFGKDLGGQIAPRGVFPAFAVSGYAEGGVLKGDRITLPSGTYPYDFAVSGNAAYMLTFRYKSESQMVEHGVWKTTDGVNFTELFTFDYHEVMMSVEYHKGWFYFGVSHKKSQPLLGTLASGTEEMAGSIYRVRCPQEPVQVVASAPSVTVTEGGSQSVAFSLSAAPASNLTLRVVCAADNTRFSVSPATLSFTTSDWATPKSVTVSLADDAVVNREVTGRLVCGADGSDPKRGLLAGDEVTAATVVLTPGDDENVAPANGEIRTADDFYCAMCRPDGDYRLMNDLDLSTAGFETIPLWSGSFDGQGHAITGLAVPICRISSGSFSNLTLDGDGATIHVIRRGVFCETVRGGAFTNCTVRGWSVRTAAGSRNDVGLFAAVAEEGSVFSGCTTAADCEVGQEAQQVDINLGGFVGKVTATNATVYGTVAVFDGCTNNAAISGVGCNNTSYGRGGFVGAIVGFSSAATPYPEVDFVRSANFGAVTSTGKMENLGGFVGKVDGAGNNKTCVLARFEGCGNFGVVTSSGAGNSCGGIVGLVNACANAVLDGCTNNAAIGSETVTQSGGLVGCFANASKLDVGGMAIDDCANLADVTAKTYAGGLVGTASSNGGWGTGKFQFFDSMNTGAVSAVSATNAEIIANCSFSSTSAATTLAVSNCVTVTGNLCVSCSKTPVANDNKLLSELPPEEPDTPPEEPEEPVGLNNLGAPEGDRFDLPLQQTWPEADYGAEVCLWRYDRYAALSFGHDDNCDWDIPFLLRESERNGFKLTWWLITKNIGDTGSTSGSGNWPEWRECFAAGHAIESHSHTHEWAGGGQTVQAAAAAAGMSVEDYVEFCMYSNSLAVIREKIPGCKPSTLAFPGGESYPEIANRYFVSGRSVGPYINRANAINYQSVNASSSGINPGTVNVLLGGRGGSKALTGWMASFNDAKNYRGWFVPFLHTESTHDGLPNAGHEQGVAEQIQRFELLGRHRRHLWLGTYPAVAKYGQSRDTATLTVVKKTASEITFTLVDQMRDDWYDESLTVKVRLPAAWAQSGVAATQGGKSLDAFYVEHGGAKYALVNAVPDRGEVTLVPAAMNSGTWDETSYEQPIYTYQVTFFDTDGTTVLKRIIARPINTSAAELAPIIYNPGHRLVWTTTDGVAIDDITNDVDFVASWVATDERPRAVFVDDSTGEELTFVETVYGDRPAQPADLPTREGYIAYWEPDLGPIVSNTQFRVKYMRDDDPIPGAIIVRTAEEFCDAMANHPNAVIRMVRDIDISGYGYTAVPEFSGTFKAYGHILAGLGDTSLCVTNSGAFVGLKVLGDSDAGHPVLASGYGVFAVVSDAGVFTDCRVDGYAIRANAQYLAYGVFVGTALKGTAFTNCTVGATCSIDQGSKPNNEIGGFVGLLSVADPLGTLITFAHCTNEAPIYATGDYNTAHGDGGFIGRATGCGAASTPEILFVNCAETGLVSSSGGKSNLGGYIGYIPGLTANSTCKVVFEGCTTTMPIGASANAVGEWIGLASNVVIEQKEYIPPEEPDNPPVGPDDPPVEPEKPTEFVTNDWFDVEFEDDGYKAGSDWAKTSTDKSGGTWSGDDGGATTLDGTTFVVTLTDAFEGELRYTPSKASDADADVVVEGTMEVSAAARDIRPEDVPFALTFESKQSGNLTPVAYIGGAWHSFGTTGFAADAWVDWKVEVDQTSTNAPRIKVTIAQKGGAVETSGWIAGGFAAKQVSALSYIGVGSFGDFKARYLTVKGGEVIELVPPEFAADGSALGFKSGIGEARMFTLKITNPVKGAYYTVLTSTTLEGPFLPEGGSVLFDQDSGTLTLEVSADTPQKFAKILVSVSPID